MTTTWNNTAPAVGNQISADIPDIPDNFAHLKSGLVRIREDTGSDSDLTAFKIDTTVGFNDGTYNVEFPTNGIAAHSVIMLGNSSTIVWMYLNTAPPGWKVTATGKDTVLGVVADSGDYAVTGGSADTSATWKFEHNHIWQSTENTGGRQLVDESGSDQSYAVDGATGQPMGGNNVLYTKLSTLESWRPKASVGKLFQLDTA
jgi:hypothetical protein